MSDGNTLSVRNLSIEFGGVHAVEDVSFDVEPGETFAIIGPNGAGKSTIFNLISRLYEPTAGSIHYGDTDLLKLPAHKVVRASAHCVRAVLVVRANGAVESAVQKVFVFNTSSSYGRCR